jgi:sulfur carrier protein
VNVHKRQRVTLGRGGGRGDNGGMDIVLNGEPRSLAPALTVLQLLQREGLADRRVAVEVNGDIVPRSRHGEHALTPGDRVEIVHALGGG